MKKIIFMSILFLTTVCLAQAPWSGTGIANSSTTLVLEPNTFTYGKISSIVDNEQYLEFTFSCLYQINNTISQNGYQGATATLNRRLIDVVYTGSTTFSRIDLIKYGGNGYEGGKFSFNATGSQNISPILPIGFGSREPGKFTAFYPSVAQVNCATPDRYQYPPVSQTFVENVSTFLPISGSTFSGDTNLVFLYLDYWGNRIVDRKVSSCSAAQSFMYNTDGRPEVQSNVGNLYWKVRAYKTCPNGEASYFASNMVANPDMGNAINRYDPAAAQTRDCVNENENCASIGTGGNTLSYRFGYGRTINEEYSGGTVDFSQYVSAGRDRNCRIEVYRRQGTGNTFAKVTPENFRNYTPAMTNVGDTEDFELVRVCGLPGSESRCKLASLKLKKVPPCDLATTVSITTTVKNGANYTNSSKICVKKNCNSTAFYMKFRSPTTLEADANIYFNWVGGKAGFDFTKVVSMGGPLNSSTLEVYLKVPSENGIKWFKVNSTNYIPDVNTTAEVRREQFKFVYKASDSDRCFIGSVRLEVYRCESCFVGAKPTTSQDVQNSIYYCSAEKVNTDFDYIQLLPVEACSGTDRAQHYTMVGFKDVAMNGTLNQFTTNGSKYFSSNLEYINNPADLQYGPDAPSLTSILGLRPACNNVGGLKENTYSMIFTSPRGNADLRPNVIISTSKTILNADTYNSFVEINGPSTFFVIEAARNMVFGSKVIWRSLVHVANPAAAPGRRTSVTGASQMPNYKFYSFPSSIGIGEWFSTKLIPFSSPYTYQEQDLDKLKINTGGMKFCQTFQTGATKYTLNSNFMSQFPNGSAGTIQACMTNGKVDYNLCPFLFTKTSDTPEIKRVKVCSNCNKIETQNLEITFLSKGSTTAEVTAGGGTGAVTTNATGLVSAEGTFGGKADVYVAGVGNTPCSTASSFENKMIVWDIAENALPCNGVAYIGGSLYSSSGTPSFRSANTQLNNNETIDLNLNNFYKQLNQDATNLTNIEKLNLNPTFPNPFTTELNIKFTASGNEDAFFEVFDIQGKKMYNSTAQKQEAGSFVQETLDTSNWAAGMYIIKTYGGNGESSTQKIIKQ